MMAQLKAMKAVMQRDDAARYGNYFKPTSRTILYGFVSSVWCALDRIRYRHQYINWDVDENTRHWLSSSGATQFLLALETCQNLEVLYKEDEYNGMRLAKDDLHAQLPRMQELASRVIEQARDLMIKHKTDEPASVLHAQFAVRKTKKNRFTI